MEHDDELRIREKIRNLDNQPQAWDKELVWSSVRFHGTKPARRIFVYYAAASLVLAAGIVFYSVELTERVALRARISELDLALEQTRSASRPKDTNQVVSIVECPEIKQSPTQLPRFATRMNRSGPVVIVKSKVPDESNPVSQAAVAKETPQTEAVVATPVEQINPILEPTAPPTSLVILGKSFTVADHSAQKKGRLKMRLFQGEDDEAIGTSSSIPITTLASINN